MENVFAQIDSIFQGETDQKPSWADEILQELKEIKTLLKEQQTQPPKQTKISKDFYSFIKEFRKSLMADIQNNIFPTYNYEGKRLGIDFKGLIYDKETSNYLSKDEAYRVYKYAYQEHLNQISA